MKRALVSLLVAFAAACSDPTGSMFDRFGIPEERAPDLAVGEPVPFALQATSTADRPEKLRSELLLGANQASVHVRFATRSCSALSAGAGRTGNELVLRVTITGNPAALCEGEAWVPVRYTATIGGLAPGAYRIRVIHDDRLIDHRYLVRDESFTLP